MAFLLSAKGKDITAWHAATDFAAAYRQALLERTASDSYGSTKALFVEALSELERLAAEHEAILAQLDGLLLEAAATTQPDRLRELTILFYDKLYHQMALFHSAPAFYQMSMTFLKQLSSSLMNHVSEQLGLFAQRIPAVSLVALGPAGRSEFTPFCPLQLMMVHGDATASELETLSLFSHILHDGFEKTGLRIDPVITPRNPAWRGSYTNWQQRCTDGLQLQKTADIIDLLRLADQYPLPPHEEIGHALKDISIPLLQGNRTALSNLVTRMESLSNGLGMMGNLKLERRKPESGLFRLLDHGLLPLSSAISVLALIKGIAANSIPQRIRELLARHELDVDLAERMLATWHTLHELRLLREKPFSIDPNNNQPLYLNPDDLDDDQLDALKAALESVGFIQRQVGSIFSRMEA